MSEAALLERPTADKTYSKDDIIPSSAWGKDHWSTLSYVEAVATDCAGFQVGADARMRSTRRNLRVMQSECPRPKRAGARSWPHAVDSHHGTRLRDGSEVDGHDDWACLQDLAAEGLFTSNEQDIEPGEVLHLSKKGKAWASALRSHKQAGGAFSTFTADGLPQMELEGKAPPKEVFVWMNKRIDVSAILADIASKKLRPKEVTMDAEFVATYARTFLGIDKAKRDVDQIGSLFIAVSSKHALELPQEVLDQPAILIYVGKGKGVLKTEGDTADYLLCDGNHRYIRAYMDDLGDRKAYVLSPAQSRAYRK
ncbi:MULTISPECIES: hypothetical protein [unclassified Variovorax]|uniref:hypothetical protein n=1 Tax=unclassified Variovorax TaxID=663243 RepID=UPI0013171939|nr:MULTISPECIES: hypothetical protein [unclassified Variovorax]VTU42999.1 hypothetical protein H6P1_00332 [Variovorax sp. PBL-H6]VTU43527.1 hypothetical protein SRS16P1_00573 [Variovorax sp. SRS16]VTU43587.1 hypothetical protein E5P1_00567 [Variovorax sp. PBL-E5]